MEVLKLNKLDDKSSVTIEEISKKIAENFDNVVAKAFVYGVWKLLKASGINVVLSRSEIDVLEDYRDGQNKCVMNYALGFTDLDTSEHDTNLIDEILKLPRLNHYDMYDELMYQSIRVDDIERLREERKND